MSSPLVGEKRKLVLRMAGTGFALAKLVQMMGFASEHPDIARLVTQLLNDQRVLNPQPAVHIEQEEAGFTVVEA